jgi:tetratricopeptide (TPR) repeat protein
LLASPDIVLSLAGEPMRADNEIRRQNLPGRSIPDHVIRYEENLSPLWKNTWDLARQLYRDEKYREALVQYEILLARKANIDEARWEYATILMHLGRWRQAAEQLERLLAVDPQNKKYLFDLALVSLETGQADKAAEMYGQLRENAADDREKETAVEGLVRSFELLDDKEAMLPLLEELAAGRPLDQELQKRQAALLMEMGHFDNAAAVLEQLERRRPEDAAVLSMKASLLEKSGYPDHAAVYWQKVIVLNPDNMNAHQVLQHYFEQKENWKMSLKHLEAMLKKTPYSAELLERAADLNMKIGRIDDALIYYDYSLAVRPENTTVQQKKTAAQKMLACDLLVLVENDGGKKLWQDLLQVTTDRPGIYREIAELLRKKGQTDELIDVLTLLYHENPQDERTYRELTVLLEKQSRSDELSDLLKKKE